MKEAQRAENSSKMNAVQNKGRQLEKGKVKMQTNEKDVFCTSQIDSFDTMQEQAAIERRRRDGLPPLVTVPIPRAILGKCRLSNAGVFASSSVSAKRDVFEPQSILLNYATYVANQWIRVGREKEGKEGKREKKDEKRSTNEFVSDKDEKGSLCLIDECINNEIEEEEEDGFDKDIRKAQKEKGAKEKKNKKQKTRISL
ncbi:uncharacterized protein MONOS_1785 [Monocercomonoides exilis]|uniref:uncharacterized protein n=1 Tax=Monocercomonoides exilis TaxID=2049356 RepID=UPI00355A880D|nr:hypothetical protein MONOS_1785 [Monocercomonoides exilis]|eukprot:MONOS_1785.1-p1 / transcript=MONOS_1785.1 / gene=MONOS_1785 / organism=Monocercomonoides_exilis_PA203 / gene_product=unspecified product / transcript_product=unspecified product / location=Mono_scaffold00033:126550-127463(-) / protein_length=199 / sequence_SO=supercontig / SO=protein_coding / is_pseudo=false